MLKSMCLFAWLCGGAEGRGGGQCVLAMCCISVRKVLLLQAHVCCAVDASS